MSESLRNLAASTGVDSGTIEQVLGCVLSFIKTHVSPETYEMIEAKVPEARRLVSGSSTAEAEAGAEGPEGGLLGKISSLAGSLLGGDSSGGDLLAKLLKLGIPVDSITAILPKIFAFLAAHLPADVLKQIVAALPDVPGIDAAALLSKPATTLEDTVDYPDVAARIPDAAD
jgi:hypothetical protein